MDEKAYPLVEENREKDRRSDTSKPSENGSSTDKLVVILNDDEPVPLKERIQSQPGGNIVTTSAQVAPVATGGKQSEDEDIMMGECELEEFDWAAADAEVDEVMAEDDNEDGDEDEDEESAMDSTDER